MSGEKNEHLSLPVLPKQGIQFKETWAYFKNWRLPEMKFSGRVKPDIASGLPVTQLHDTILHSSFYQPTDPIKWPAGTYGIPKPKTGCPSSDGFQWMTGSRSQDTSNNESKNIKSASFHLDAVVDKKKVCDPAA